jgi:hypothetical protein
MAWRRGHAHSILYWVFHKRGGNTAPDTGSAFDVAIGTHTHTSIILFSFALSLSRARARSLAHLDEAASCNVIA